MGKFRWLSFQIGLLMAFGLFVALSACGKCPARFVIVHGSIEGELLEDAVVQLEISPDPKYKASPARVVDGKYEAKALFDSYKSLAWFGRHNCSRKPESVVVVLTAKNEEYSRVTLGVSRDFQETKEGDFTVRSPVVLNAKLQ